MNYTQQTQSCSGQPKMRFDMVTQYNSLDNANNQSEISLTLVINGFRLVTNELKTTKYNDFILSLQKEHFPELIKENQLILAERWNPVIPQSIDTKIEEVLSCNVPRYHVWKLHDFLLDGAHRQEELQAINNAYFDEIHKDNWKIKYQELEKLYNTLREQFNLLESTYLEYFKKTDQKKFFKANQLVAPTTTNIYTCKLIEDRNSAEKKYQNLLNENSFLQQQINGLKQVNTQLYTNNLDLQQQITQLQVKQQVFQTQQTLEIPQTQTEQIQKKQSKLIIKEIDQSNNSKLEKKNSNLKIRILTKNEISSQEIFENTHLFKTTNKHNPESGQQPSNCSYCKKDCPEYVELPCLQRYHQYCFEELGRKLYIDQQPTAKCICSKKISTKLFTQETQFLLLSHQAGLIYEKQKEQLKKCKDCEFFYKSVQPVNNCPPYCPNCFRFITESCY